MFFNQYFYNVLFKITLSSKHNHSAICNGHKGQNHASVDMKKKLTALDNKVIIEFSHISCIWIV